MVSATDLELLRSDAGPGVHMDTVESIILSITSGEDDGESSTQNSPFLVEKGLIPALTKALKQDYNQYGRYFDLTFSIITLLGFDTVDNGSEVAAMAVIADGGLECVLEYTQAKNQPHGGVTEENDGSFDAMACLSLIFNCFDALVNNEQELLKLSKMVLPATVDIVNQFGLSKSNTTKNNSKPSDIFQLGCAIMMLCLRSGLRYNFIKIAQLVWSGIDVHRGDQAAQIAGRLLLSRYLGEGNAIKRTSREHNSKCSLGSVY